jgi:hypothetical protein
VASESKSSTYTKEQTWGALKRAWKGYRIAKVQNDAARMEEYSKRIRTLQQELGLPQTNFTKATSAA